MTRNINLINYLPKYIQEFNEIKQIMFGENEEIQDTVDETEIIKNNQFILTCNEIGIFKFERMLNILPNTYDTLEARISRVLTRWNDSIPYTYRSLCLKLDEMCGVNKYQMLPNFGDYYLNIVVSLGMSGQVAELERLVKLTVPANVEVECTNLLGFNSNGYIKTASANIKMLNFTINQENIIANGDFFTATKTVEYSLG